jgi:hypothetical protein
MTRSYAGIGSRETPAAVCRAMARVAGRLARADFELRSGHAEGADIAFEYGVPPAWTQHSLIFLPWSGFNAHLPDVGPVRGREIVVRSSFKADQLVRDYHPHPERLTQGAFALHRRNGYQVLGEFLTAPADFIVCWRDPRKARSGTDQALRIAEAFGVPVYNLAILAPSTCKETDDKELDSAIETLLRKVLAPPNKAHLRVF